MQFPLLSQDMNVEKYVSISKHTRAKSEKVILLGIKKKTKIDEEQEQELIGTNTSIKSF